ncbi:MAG TPA: periplasmic heavy metal sensor [Caulobacterales bacterium]|nr:periplasmic heavy metal sensor [Caulobacterales bacterium]
MTLGLRGLLITALVALSAGFAGVGLGKLAFDRSPRQPSLHEVIHNELHLSPEQMQRIESLEASFASRKQALELEMRAANAELASAIREEHGYGPRVTSAVERFHHAMGQLQTETIRHVFAMREVLTPEQKEVFDNTVVSALTAEQQ